MVDVYDLPEWFHQYTPLSMDPLMGPDMQYRAGARDMLEVIRSHPEVLVSEDLKESGNRLTEARRRAKTSGGTRHYD